jgi:4-amino-4-deoxy-L-arabinose transferase-like glycosyltransferase
MGFNAYALRGSAAPLWASGASLRRTGEVWGIAVTKSHYQDERGPMALWGSAETGDLRSLAAGGLGIGLAVASKGMVAAALSGLCLVLFLWGRGRLRLLVSPRILVGLATFALAIAPVLICYYLQFDLHPEKVVRGRTGVSGVRFILLGQSADRFTGGHGEAASGDYLFFFHSLLWAFLPWTALLLAAWGLRLRALWRGRLAAFRATEQLGFLGPLLYVSLLNLSRFKLPHYLNLAFPLLAVLAAGTMAGLAGGGKRGAVRALTRVQDVVVVLLLVVAVFLNGWAFPVRSAGVLVVAAGFLVVLALAFRLRDPLQRLWVPSGVAILLFNFVLEASFYPQLSRLQPGSEFARTVLALDVDFSRFYFLGENVYQPFQLYTGHLVPAVQPEVVARLVSDGKPAFALVADDGVALLEQEGLRVSELARSPACRITMVRWPMLDPRTRDAACPPARLVRIERRAGGG